MNVYTYRITGRYSYQEIGIIQANSLEEAQSMLDEVLRPGPLKGIASVPSFDENGMQELFATNS